MKKMMVFLAVAVLALAVLAPISQAKPKSRVKGFFIGSCLGVRSATAYNEGKDLSIREWGLLIPGFQCYIMVMNGIDGKNGKTNRDLAKQYGSNFF